MKASKLAIVLLGCNTLVLFFYVVGIPFIMDTYSVGMCHSIIEPYHSMALCIMSFAGLWLILSIFNTALLNKHLPQKITNTIYAIENFNKTAYLVYSIILMCIVLWAVYLMATQLFIMGCVI